MVKTPNRPKVRCKSRKKQDFKETFLFLKITFWKKKTLTFLVDYSTLLFLTGITFQICKSTRHSTTTRYYNSSTFSYITLQTTRVCTHTSWLPEKPAAARSARGHDKVQTCYSHQGNIDTCTLGGMFQEFGGRLQ
jgi:hypothetical protein